MWLERSYSVFPLKQQENQVDYFTSIDNQAHFTHFAATENFSYYSGKYDRAGSLNITSQ